jgi:hypothetical protein
MDEHEEPPDQDDQLTMLQHHSESFEFEEVALSLKD